MQHGQNDLGRCEVFVLGVKVDGNATAVVDHFDSTVVSDPYVDAGTVPRHRLVHSVIHNFPHKVVEPCWTGGSNVHTRPFADRFEALKDLN